MKTQTIKPMLVAALIAGTLAGCGDGKDSESDTSSAGAAQVMLVGSFTGDAAAPFANMPDVATAAAAAFSKRGGEHREVEMVICDDKGDPNENLKCGRDAVKDKIDAVVTLNQDVAPGVKILEKADIPVIAVLGFDEAELTSPNVFNISGGAPGIAAAAVTALVEGSDAESIAIFAQSDPPSRAAAKGAEQVLKARGIKAERNTFVESTASDLAPAARASTRDGVDGVIALAQFNVLAPYLKAVSQADVKGVIFASSDENVPPSVIPTFGDAAEGMLIGSIYKPLTDETDAAVKTFIDDLAAGPKPVDPRKEVLPWAAEGVYVAIGTASHAASMVDGDVTGPKLLKALPAVKGYDTGLVAPLSFDQATTGFEGVTRVFNTKALVGKVVDGQITVEDSTAWVDYFGNN